MTITKHKYNRCGPTVCGVQTQGKSNTPHMNRFHSPTLWQMLDGKSCETSRAQMWVRSKQSMYSCWGRSNGDSLWTIFTGEKEKQNRKKSPPDTLVYLGSYFVFSFLDPPPCFCHLTFWMAAVMEDTSFFTGSMGFGWINRRQFHSIYWHKVFKPTKQSLQKLEIMYFPLKVWWSDLHVISMVFIMQWLHLFKL